MYIFLKVNIYTYVHAYLRTYKYMVMLARFASINIARIILCKNYIKKRKIIFELFNNKICKHHSSWFL